MFCSIYFTTGSGIIVKHWIYGLIFGIYRNYVQMFRYFTSSVYDFCLVYFPGSFYEYQCSFVIEESVRWKRLYLQILVVLLIVSGKRWPPFFRYRKLLKVFILYIFYIRRLLLLP